MKYKFQDLLNEFSQISKLKKDLTFLEISGYPHYENVCSNILSFYLDPEREHNLSNLVLKSLLACCGLELELSNISIEREVPTNKGRIDLVIESDSHIVAIENKIFHSPENPFQDYEEKINELADGRDCIFFILGLRVENSPKLGKFSSITYPQLFNNIKINLGNYIQSSNNKYLIFLTEFITSIENLISGSTMDKDVISFFENHSKETTEFIKSFNQVRRELRSKVEHIKNNLPISQPAITKKGLYRESNCLFDCVYHDIELDNQNIAIDCYVSPAGWEITAFPRSGSIEQLKESLSKRNIEFETGQRLKIGKNYPYEHPIEQIMSVLEDFIQSATRT